MLLTSTVNEVRTKTGGIYGATKQAPTTTPTNSRQAGVKEGAPLDGNAQIQDAQRRGTHADALDGEGEVPRVARRNMQQFRKDGKRDCSASLTCAASHEGTEDHGERDSPIRNQVVQGAATTEDQPDRPDKDSDHQVETKSASPAD